MIWAGGIILKIATQLKSDFLEVEVGSNPLLSSPDTNSLNTQLTETSMPEQVVSVSFKGILPDEDPYPDKTPKQMLEREYLLLTQELPSDTVVSFHPYALLRTKSTITKYLSNFRFLQSRMRIRIQLLTTPMQYGAIGVAALPYLDASADYTNIKQLSQANMEILDVSLQQCIEMELPYLRPQVFYDLFEDPADVFDWRIFLYPFAKESLTVAGSDTVTIKVFGSFVSPHCAGYLPSVEGEFQMRPARQWLPKVSGAAKALGYAGAAAAIGTATDALDAGNAMYEAANSWYSSTGTEDEKHVNTDAPSATLDLIGDISTPGGSTITKFKPLGDNVAMHDRPVVSKQGSRLSEIMSIPTYLQRNTLSLDGPENAVLLNAGPFNELSYAEYFRPMFKYFRGGSRVLLKFFSSPLVSSRVQITLNVASAPQEGEDGFGDVLTWVVDIKGSVDWSVRIPYLQDTLWKQTNLNDYLQPTLSVVLMDPLPQPYDKPPSVIMLSFVSADADFRFAGLQSFVPSGSFQCLKDEIDQSLVLGSNVPQGYQGRDFDVYDIITRYSSRDPDPAFLAPMPVFIADAETAFKLDNFDYICNLFAFYTGPVNVKMMFSQAPAGGNLKAAYGNSTIDAVGGRTFKAGNSMVISNQAVWPTLEFQFPYNCENEMQSLKHPFPIFPQVIDQESTVSEWLIAASQGFALRYLMPVPVFAVEGIFQSEIGEFQMFRPTIYKNYPFRLQSSAGTAGPIFIDTGDFDEETYVLELDCVARATSGTTACSYLAQIRNDSSAPVPVPSPGTIASYDPAAILTASGRWATDYLVPVRYQMVVGGSFTSNLYLSFSQNTSSTDVEYVGVIRILPYTSVSLLASTTYTTLKGDVNFPVDQDVTVTNTVFIQTGDPLAVEVGNTVTVEGVVEAVPAGIAEVFVSNTPLHVTMY